MWLARATVRMCGRLQFDIKETEAVVPMWLPDWSLVARLESLDFAAAEEK